MKSNVHSSIFNPFRIWPTLIICFGLVSANKVTTGRQLAHDVEFWDASKVNSSTDYFPGQLPSSNMDFGDAINVNSSTDNLPEQLSSSTTSVHNLEPDTKISLLDFIDRNSKMLANLKYLRQSNWEVLQGRLHSPKDDAESKLTKRHTENFRPSVESDGALLDDFPPELITSLTSQMINSTWIHPYLLALYNTSMITAEEPSPSAELKRPPSNTALEATPLNEPHSGRWRFGRALDLKDTEMGLSQNISSLYATEMDLSQNISSLMNALMNTSLNGTAMDLLQHFSAMSELVNTTGPPAPTPPLPYNLTKGYDMMVPEMFAYLYDMVIHKSLTAVAMMVFGEDMATELKNYLDHIATFISALREGRDHLELFGASITMKEEPCGEQDCPYLTEPDKMCIKSTKRLMNCSWVEIMPLDQSYPRQWWVMEVLSGIVQPEFFNNMCMCPPQISLDCPELLVQMMAQYINTCETQILVNKWHGLKTWPPKMTMG